MESSITKPQSFNDLELAEPHFDDEVTLLSARPVVPLHEVSARRRFGRGLGFGLTVIAALLIGALSATLVYKLGEANGQLAAPEKKGEAQQQQPETQLQDAYGGITSTASNAPESAATFTPEQETVDLNTDPGLQKEPEQKQPEQKEPDKRISTKPAGSEPIIRDRDRAAEAPANSETFDPKEIENKPAEYDGEMRRESRREARRLKHGKRGRPDDAARIREIFEGSPRP